GFLQYLNWNGRLPDSMLQRRLSWDELRDEVSRFYTCAPCVTAYQQQVDHLVGRTNKITGKRYADDPTIMTWELANEPRPMRPSSNEAYVQWCRETAAFIKARAPRQLVTLGHEGYIGTQDTALYETVHRDRNVDYLTIHIWPKNWGWFRPDSMQQDHQQVIEKTMAYLDVHREIATRLRKPLVLEEFGLPRDGQSFDPASGTRQRDQYFGLLLDQWLQSVVSGGPIAGVNFWAFGGSARPIPGQVFWKPGDDYMGDPPMEEQGLNTVFDSDSSTWKRIRNVTAAAKKVLARKGVPSVPAE
ncbi:MAG: beta-mannosidase, partial [Chitinophagaceae bacterium]